MNLKNLKWLSKQKKKKKNNRLICSILLEMSRGSAALSNCVLGGNLL